MLCMQLVCLSFGFWSLWDVRNGHCKEQNVDSNLTAHIGQEWPFFIVPEQSEKLMKAGNGTLRPWLLADDQIVSLGAINHSANLGSVGRSTRKNGTNVKAPSEKNVKDGGSHLASDKTEKETLREQNFNLSPCTGACLLSCWLIVAFVTFPPLAFAVVFHNLWCLLRGAYLKDSASSETPGSAVGRDWSQYSMQRARLRRSTLN